MVVGLIGESVVKVVELELRQELVQIRHHCMGDLNVQAVSYTHLTLPTKA